MPAEPLSILLVDDEPVVLKLVAVRLRSQGYTVRTALNGKVAYELLKDEKSQLIVCDVVMPVMDGPSLCRLLRSEGDKTPFLFLTAKGQPQDIVNVLSAGADDYVVKPFDAGELLARVKAMFRRFYPSQQGPSKPT